MAKRPGLPLARCATCRALSPHCRRTGQSPADRGRAGTTCGSHATFQGRASHLPSGLRLISHAFGYRRSCSYAGRATKKEAQEGRKPTKGASAPRLQMHVSRFHWYRIGQSGAARRARRRNRCCPRAQLPRRCLRRVRPSPAAEACGARVVVQPGPGADNPRTSHCCAGVVVHLHLLRHSAPAPPSSLRFESAGYP